MGCLLLAAVLWRVAVTTFDGGRDADRLLATNLFVLLGVAYIVEFPAAAKALNESAGAGHLVTNEAYSGSVR